MEINVNKGANWTFNQFLAVDQIQGVPWQIGQSKYEAIFSKVEIFLEQREVAFLSLSKIC